MARGYDPYNNPGKKPKTPAWKKASPNNPRNNAGPKIKSSSRGPTTQAQYRQDTNKRLRATYNNERPLTENNVNKAGKRATNKAAATKASGPNNFGNIKGKGFTPSVGAQAHSSAEARVGMMRKNAAKAKAVKAKPSKIGWAKAGGAKAKGSMVKWGTAGAAKAAPRAVGASTVRFAGAVARGANAMGAVLLAGQAGYAVGTAIYNKNATKIQDTLDKVVRRKK